MTVERAIEMLRENIEYERDNHDPEPMKEDETVFWEWIETQELAIVALEKMQCSTSI